MKVGDLVQITIRRRGSKNPFPVGILLEIRTVRDLFEDLTEECVVLSNGTQRVINVRYLRGLDGSG